MGKPSRDRRSPSSGSSSSSLVDQTGSSSRSGVYTGSSSRSEVLTGSLSRSGAYTGSSSRSEVLTGSSSRSPVVPGSDSRSSFRSPSISRSLSRSRSRSRTPLRRVRSQSPITPPLRKRKASPIQKSFVLRIDNLGCNVNEGQLKDNFGIFGEVVNVELPMDHSDNLPKGYGYVEFKAEEDAKMAKFYLHGNEINGNSIKVEFSFVSLPLKAITTLSKIDAPKTNNISDGEEDRLKRHREASPCRKPLASPRRGSPIQRDGSPRRLPDSPLRRRADSPAHRRVESPYRRDDTHPRRRSTSLGRGPSPLMLNTSPSSLRS
ncbi:serine/arginine-rich splicing factor SR45-like [Alnus glutinosa]|uniref:serine/arginine-rich splicing factor SR45-like n=1 Tax=Alnus glutinosa TaxID=3517 RepID=UPI002D77CB8F|nr:serine/arginine-rich splicing factor SR45-like [Alnus glutinosa]